MRVDVREIEEQKTRSRSSRAYTPIVAASKKPVARVSTRRSSYRIKRDYIDNLARRAARRVLFEKGGLFAK